MPETFLEIMMLEDGALFCSMPFFKNLKINFKGVLSRPDRLHKKVSKDIILTVEFGSVTNYKKKRERQAGKHIKRRKYLPIHSYYKKFCLKS